MQAILCFRGSNQSLSLCHHISCAFSNSLLYTLVASLAVFASPDQVSHQDHNDKDGQGNADRDRNDVVWLGITINGGLKTEKYLKTRNRNFCIILYILSWKSEKCP